MKLFLNRIYTGNKATENKAFESITPQNRLYGHKRGDTNEMTTINYEFSFKHIFGSMDTKSRQTITVGEEHQ
jgi:hypothetical protein